MLCALALLLGTAWQEAHAQQVRSLEIRDGKVYIDGQLIAKEQLPASLDVAGTEARFSFIGDAQPIVELNGRLYRMEGKRLQELGSEADRVSIQFRDGTWPSPSARLAPPGAAAPVFFTPDKAQAGGWGQQAQELKEQAQELAQLGEKLGQQHIRGLDGTAQELTQHAQRLAQVVQQLPQIEVQRYLNEIQRHDAELYRQLVQEQTLELKTLELAAHIKALPEGQRRTELKGQLRDQLEEIFELKQQNRRREIEQLEAQLRELQHRMEERERLHRQIIDKRLEELIGQGEARDW